MSNEVSLAEAQGPLTEAMQQFSGRENGRQRFDEFKLWLKNAATYYLRRLYETETITVGATDGTETIPGLSASAHATEAADVIVEEQIVNGKFAVLFGSKGPARRRWARSQVAKFSIDNPTKLRGDGYGNFFELEDGSVAHVFVRVGGQPDALVYGFGNDFVWRAYSRHRVFSLQQEL